MTPHDANAAPTKEHPRVEPPPCVACGGRRFETIDEAICLRRCARCGLGFIWPQPPDDHLATLYDQDYYTRPIDPGGPSYIENREGLERFFDQCLAQLERLVEPGRLLEVGCGLGYLLNVARRRGWEALGLEVSEFASTYAREQFGHEVRRQSLEEADLAPATFDAVVMRDVVEHSRDPRRLLRAAWRVLRPGGVVALSAPNFGSLNAALAPTRWRHLRPEQHLFHFTPQAMRQLLERCGFRVVEISSRYDSPATREVYAALARRRERLRLAWHAAARGDIVFLPLGSNLRRLLRGLAVVFSCISRPFRSTLLDDILEVHALKVEAAQ